MRYHRLAGVVLAGSFVWLALAPGWRTFLVFFAAFSLWSVAYGVFLARRAFDEGKRAIGRIEGKLLGEPAEDEPQPVDPALLPLARDLGTLGRDPGLSTEAARARRQLRILPELDANLKGLLEQKLNPGELTHARYRDAGDQAVALVRRELEEVVGRMRGVFSATDARPRESFLRWLAREIFPERYGARSRSLPRPSPELELLRREQLVKVREILDGNDRALSEMVRMNVALSRMKGVSGRDETQLRELVRELEALANRASKF